MPKEPLHALLSFSLSQLSAEGRVHPLSFSLNIEKCNSKQEQVYLSAVAVNVAFNIHTDGTGALIKNCKLGFVIE